MVLIILDLSSSGSIGTSLHEVLAASNNSSHAFRLELVHVHQPGSDESRLVEALSATHPDLAVCILTSDVHMKAAQTLNLLKQRLGFTTVVAVSDANDPNDIFDLLRLGADEFLALPLDGLNVLPRIWRLLENTAASERLTREMRTHVGIGQMIGHTAAWTDQINKIPLIARCDANVLITGETGTGKELCARAVHYLSLRAGAPFIAINCGAIPENLIENELFGHTKGAFTDARGTEGGLLGEADGGTLFLDEIDTLTSAAQVKLLRFIQEKEYRPLGSSKTCHVDVRIVAATNIKLADALRTASFRRDLYYRLNVVPLSLPPLRERKEDIALLARHFLDKHATRLRRPARRFTPAAIILLETYDWPGNVRELEHIVERAVVFCNTGLIDAAHITLQTSPPSKVLESFHDAKIRTIAQFEKSYIETILMNCDGNISKAARVAQKNRRAFWELMRKHHITANK
jgi:DNA-binding NtrC family response regulator